MRLKKYIKRLRNVRVYHRFLGISLAVLLMISAITGILLSLKKEVNLIQPSTQKGMSSELTEWKSVADISNLAKAAFVQKHPNQSGNEIDRLDVRPSKGIVKVLFEKGYWEVQIDGKTGEVKSIAQRHSDWIESIHDGSIISRIFKLISMNILGLGVIFMIITGLAMWYGPKKVKHLKQKIREQKLAEKD